MIKKILFLMLIYCMFAESFIYVGQDNNGKLMAGIVNRIYLKYPTLTSYIESDVRSTGIEIIPEGYNPKEVTYQFKAYYNGLYYKHSCKHILDKINYNPESLNIIGIELLL